MDTLLYPKTTGLLGELSEPWRLENDLKPMAQDYLDASAIALTVLAPGRLTIGDAYSLYADRLCEAIDINLGNLVITPVALSWRDIENYPELRHEQ